MSFTEACRRIELILSDVDGVMTDGGIRMLDDGRQIVSFHIRDGMGIRLWREAGKKFGIVTGRDLEAVRRRAEDLKIDVVRLGIDDKQPAVDAIAAELGLAREQICYIGDDLLDLRVIQSPRG
jgi:YrbI family 3-deoxy-D-manno-octulosonate 8-phosphate phosphatase